jgi:hypothetical protein
LAKKPGALEFGVGGRGGNGDGDGHRCQPQFSAGLLRNFTTESTEFTETDGKEGKVRIRIRSPFLPAAVKSVPFVVRLRSAPTVVKSRENRG